VPNPHCEKCRQRCPPIWDLLAEIVNVKIVCTISALR
jgi:hypothetical protein